VHRRTRREAGRHVPRTEKKISENTKKMKIARNCENSHLRGVFGNWGGVGCRLVGKLSGKSAFVGNERRFCLGGFRGKAYFVRCFVYCSRVF